MNTRRIRRHRIDENRKITLTIGQLKRLVRESENSDYADNPSKERLEDSEDKFINEFSSITHEFLYTLKDCGYSYKTAIKYIQKNIDRILDGIADTEWSSSKFQALYQNSIDAILVLRMINLNQPTLVHMVEIFLDCSWLVCYIIQYQFKAFGVRAT